MEVGVYWINLAQDRHNDCCRKHGNELSGSIKCREFLSDCKLLEKASSPLSANGRHRVLALGCEYDRLNIQNVARSVPSNMKCVNI